MEIRFRPSAGLVARKDPAARRAGLAEREGEQARAEQHEAGCRQCEEPVGHQIMMTHDTPTALDVRPN
jgi:hypothetical protein